MVRETVDIRIGQEREKLDLFARETDAELAELSAEIRQKFVDNLGRMLNEDFDNFRKSLKNNLIVSGLQSLEPIINFVPGFRPGEIGGDAFSSLVQSLSASVAKSGRVNIRSLANDLAGGIMPHFFPGVSRSDNSLNLSRSQRANLLSLSISKSRRNF